MTDMDKLAELRALAEKAIPVGIWLSQGVEIQNERGSAFIIGYDQGGLVGAALPWPTELNSGDFSRVEANAAFIAAANPQTILSLLEELAKFKSAVEEIARQPLISEASAHVEDEELGDFEGAYDLCVQRARSALGDASNA